LWKNGRNGAEECGDGVPERNGKGAEECGGILFCAKKGPPAPPSKKLQLVMDVAGIDDMLCSQSLRCVLG